MPTLSSDVAFQYCGGAAVGGQGLGVCPFVCLAMILASSCTNQPVAWVRVLVQTLVVASCVVSGREMWGLLLLYTAATLLAKTLRFWNLKFFFGFEFVPLQEETNSIDFWESYLVQLPLLCLLGDFMAFRRNVLVVTSSLVSTVSMAVLSGALVSCNHLYASVVRNRKTQTNSYVPSLAVPSPTHRLIVESVVYSVNKRSKSMLLSAGLAVWSIMLGKAIMRYSVDSWGLPPTKNDERMAVEAALLVYTMLPVLDPPFARISWIFR